MKNTIIELKNKTCTKLLMSHTKDALFFVLKDCEQPLCIEVLGGCCASSWFTDIIGAKSALIGNEILDTELLSVTIDLQSIPTDKENYSFYGIKITTTKGYCDIMWRCDGGDTGMYSGDIQFKFQNIDPRYQTFEINVDDWSE
jgi:hypothetical protein